MKEYLFLQRDTHFMPFQQKLKSETMFFCISGYNNVDVLHVGLRTTNKL